MRERMAELFRDDPAYRVLHFLLGPSGFSSGCIPWG